MKRRALLKILFFTLVSVGVLSCEESGEFHSKNEIGLEETSSSLTLALQNANEFFKAIGSHTRSSRDVDNIISFYLRNTRSQVADTLIYLINYTDNQGFAILGADSKVNDIYAISPEGSLTYEDIKSDPVLLDFLWDSITYASYTPDDSISGMNGIYWRYDIVEYRPPMINATVADWTQVAPYNKYTKTENGEVAPVGCMALSLGMLLSYYEKPNGTDYTWNNSQSKFNFNWDVMVYSDESSLREDTIAKMLAFLGSKSLLNMQYTTTYGQSTGQDLIWTIDSLGGGKPLFKETLTTESMDTLSKFMLEGSKIFTKVYEAAPVISIGEREDGNDQHTWVIDGVVTRNKYRVNKYGTPMEPIGSGKGYVLYPALPLWHCVWGQVNSYKEYDGWFVYLNDKTMDPTQYDPFGSKVEKDGNWETGVTNYAKYKDWFIIGGIFGTQPTIIKPIM